MAQELDRLITIAALMELRAGRSDRTPADSDFGRAARVLEGEGVRVVVAEPGEVRFVADGAEVRGWSPDAERWERSGPWPLRAVFNRLPARHPARWEPLLAELSLLGVPVGNPPSVNRLAIDKVESLQRLAAAGFPVPEVEIDPAHFDRRLDEWGAAFAKPRFGSFGRGVRRLEPGDRPVLPAIGEFGPVLLQRAIAPPEGPWQGLCVRSFLQRLPGGPWCSAGRVARVSRTDPVANVSRGAVGLPLDELGMCGLDATLDGLERGVARWLESTAGVEAARVLEVGIDWVLDARGEPHLIEINGKPGGRLRALASRGGEAGRAWQARHVAAIAAPFRRLASLT